MEGTTMRILRTIVVDGDLAIVMSDLVDEHCVEYGCVPAADLQRDVTVMLVKVRLLAERAWRK
jgi:hypothetical protein